MPNALTLDDMSPRLRKVVGRESPRVTSTEEPDGGNLLVRIWRGAGVGNLPAYSTKPFFAPPPWLHAAGSGSSCAAMAASSAPSQSPTAAAHRKASRGCAAAWTYGSGARLGVAQGFPGARVSRRPVGDSLGGTIAHGMSRRTEVHDPAAARTSLTRPRVTPWV